MMKRVFSLGFSCVFLFLMAITPSAAVVEEYESQPVYPEILDSGYDYEILEMIPIYHTDDPEADAAARAVMNEIASLVANPIGRSSGPPPGVQQYTVNEKGGLVPYTDPFDAIAYSAASSVWVSAIKSSFYANVQDIPTSILYTHVQGGKWYSGTLNWYYMGAELVNGVWLRYLMYEGYVYYRGDLK